MVDLSAGGEGHGAVLDVAPRPVDNAASSSLSLEVIVTASSSKGVWKELWIEVALFLDAPGLLSLLQVNKAIHEALESNQTMWERLLDREHELAVERPFGSRFTQGFLRVSTKKHFILRSYQRDLSALTWRAASLGSISGDYTPRSVCVLGDSLVMTGWNNEGIIVSIKSPAWSLGGSHFDSYSFDLTRVYGETLTPIDYKRAVRFGGFSSPGYQDASAEVAVLNVREGSDCMFSSSPRYKVDWEFPTVQTQSGISVQPRGFHAATLVLDRYVLVMGGMQSPSLSRDSSTLQGMLLDTETWTWLDKTIVAAPTPGNGGSSPTNRHSFSLIWDERRQRFLIFGGSNEGEHSGGDLADVWQLAPRQKPLIDPLTPETFLSSLPWEWSLLHENAWDRCTLLDDPLSVTPGSPTQLSPSEALCLGRFHAAHQVTKDTVVFLFGSSTPSSNSLIAYNLCHDTFFRPNVQGGLPSPRLLCASVYVPKFRSIFLTGGWSTQNDGPVERSSKTIILQLVPAVVTRESPDGKRFVAFDLIPPEEPTDNRYPCLGDWHGFEIQNPTLPIYDSQVLEIRRQQRPVGQHLRMVAYNFPDDDEGDEDDGDDEDDEDNEDAAINRNVQF